MERERRVWPYLLGGLVVGTAAGILFARKPGKELRKDIKDWLKENREKSREFFYAIKESIPVKKEQVTAAFRAGKEAYKEAAMEGDRHHHRKELVNS